MARHYIGVSARGINVLRNVRSAETGEPLILLDEDEVASVLVNFADYLEGAETISSASVTANGITATISTASPNITLTLSGAGFDGSAALKVTTSTGAVFRTVIRVRKTERTTDETLLISDYA